MLVIGNDSRVLASFHSWIWCMVLPLQLQPVPEVILIEVDSNYFLLTAEIKFETRGMYFGRRNCGHSDCTRFESNRDCFQI